MLDPTISARGLFALTEDKIVLAPSLYAAPAQLANESGEVATDPSAALLANVMEGGGSSDEGASLLERLLAVEAGFELDGAIKHRPKIDIGTQLSYPEVIMLVRTTSKLREHVGQYLPHSRGALGELCRRLLRKEPLRAMMTAQRAVLATLARLMLRSVRAAFGEEQQKLKREEAERAEQ